MDLTLGLSWFLGGLDLARPTPHFALLIVEAVKKDASMLYSFYQNLLQSRMMLGACMEFHSKDIQVQS